MILYDYILIGLVVLGSIIGIIVGFGKGLSILTKGIGGIIISVVVCYFIFGSLLNIRFVSGLLESFRNTLNENGSGFCKFVLAIRVDYIVYAIVLFVVVQILRKIIVGLINKGFSADNVIVKSLNRIFGLILSIAVLCIIVLLGMQLYSLIGGVSVETTNIFEGSFFKLDYIFANNPLNSIL